MAWLLLCTHPLALALFWYAPRFWAPLDAKTFAANGSRDNKHGTFHRQRLSWRIGAVLVVALLASLPALPSQPAVLLSTAGLAVSGCAYFAYDFNPRLNRLRNLPYVAPYYVSSDPRAAFWPDRFIWRRAVRAVDLDEGDAAYVYGLRKQWAARELHRELELVLLTGLGLYLASAAAVVVVLA